MKTPNYTDEQTLKLVADYREVGNEGLDELASKLNKTVKSVRSKLVREGVYVAPDKPAPKPKDDGPTKKELIATLGDLTGSKLEGIDGATKASIKELIGHFENKANDTPETVTAE